MTRAAYASIMATDVAKIAPRRYNECSRCGQDITNAPRLGRCRDCSIVLRMEARDVAAPDYPDQGRPGRQRKRDTRVGRQRTKSSQGKAA